MARTFMSIQRTAWPLMVTSSRSTQSGVLREPYQMGMCE